MHLNCVTADNIVSHMHRLTNSQISSLPKREGPVGQHKTAADRSILDVDDHRDWGKKRDIGYGTSRCHHQRVSETEGGQ